MSPYFFSTSTYIEYAVQAKNYGLHSISLHNSLGQVNLLARQVDFNKVLCSFESRGIKNILVMSSPVFVICLSDGKPVQYI